MVVLLHKRVQLDILKNAKSSTFKTRSLDALPQHSHNLLLAMEESIAALYSPQDPSAIRSSTTSLAENVIQLKTVLYDQEFLGTESAGSEGAADVEALAKKMTEVSVNSSSAHSKTHNIRKWFDTCFDQIQKLSQTIIASLDEDSNIS